MQLTILPSLDSGSLLHQRYLIQNLLDSNRLYKLYQALDTAQAHQPCLIKGINLLSQDLFVLRQLRMQLQREAIVFYQLHHPQVIYFRSLFEHAETLFLVQDFVQGTTYRQLWQIRQIQGRSFSVPEVIQLFAQLLPMLNTVHNHGVVHGNNGNIRLESIIAQQPDDETQTGKRRLDDTPEGIPVLMEFGERTLTNYLKINAPDSPAASLDSRMQSTYSSTHSSTYLSDLIALQHTQLKSPQSDFYRLAIAGLTMLTGLAPEKLFDGQINLRDRQSYACLSNRFAAILQKMLSAQSSEQDQSALEVQTDLHSLLRQQETPEICKTGRVPTGLSPMIAPIAVYSQGNIGQASLPTTILQASTPLQGHQKTRRQWFHGRHQFTVSRLQSHLKQLKSYKTTVKFGLVAIALTGLAGGILHSNPSDVKHGIWISGIRVSRAEASQIIAHDLSTPPETHTNSALLPPAIASSNILSGASQHDSIPQPIVFAPGQASLVISQTLQHSSAEAYNLKVLPGETLTVTLEGSEVSMNLTQVTQSRGNIVHYGSNWTGRFTDETSCLIQVIGSGSYVLNLTRSLS